MYTKVSTYTSYMQVRSLIALETAKEGHFLREKVPSKRNVNLGNNGISY